MENKKQVFLSLETARKMYKDLNKNDSCKTIRNWLIEIYTKEELEAEELPKSWKELKTVHGFYTSINCVIIKLNEDIYNNGTINANKNVFPTKELADASLALSQLLQLRDVYNGDWKVDLNNRPNETKYFINNTYNKIHTGRSDTGWNYVLSFKCKDIRDQFVNNFTELLETALPLL